MGKIILFPIHYVPKKKKLFAQDLVDQIFTNLFPLFMPKYTQNVQYRINIMCLCIVQSKAP